VGAGLQISPYEPTADFWSDGAEKQRWIGLPDGQNIGIDAEGDWDFPNGTVLEKNFRLDNRLVETRLFMRHPDGIWGGYGYEWNAEQADATLVRGGKQVKVGAHTWVYPSESQCTQSHTPAAGHSLGLETRQLASAITYPQTNRTANQLVTLNAINTLAPPIANPAAETASPKPTGAADTLTERVLICAPTAHSAIAPAARRHRTWICVTRQRSQASTHAMSRHP